MRPLTGTRTDRHGREHARQRRPLLRQPAGARRATSSRRTAAAQEMDDVPPALLHAFKELDLGEDGERVRAGRVRPVHVRRHRVGPGPDETFSGSLDGRRRRPRGRRSRRSGPAHTAGDVIAWLPDATWCSPATSLFHGSTPIMWAGPPSAAGSPPAGGSASWHRRSSSPVTARSVTWRRRGDGRLPGLARGGGPTPPRGRL